MKLKIDNLVVCVGEKIILSGVNMQIGSGEVHALMGPNGSGKSTLAYTIMGHPHFKVLSGKIELLGDNHRQSVNILELTPALRFEQGIFLAFQYPVQVEGISVQAFLWEAYKNKESKSKMDVASAILNFREFKKKLLSYCEKLGLSEEFLKRNLNEGFSGGERKKLEVLQILSLRPQILVLDETDSGTDIDSLKRVAVAIKDYLKEEKKASVLVITHYNRILKLLRPDVVHIFANGRVVLSGDYSLASKIEREGYKDSLELLSAQREPFQTEKD
jgi:Fe-S cluster assembly ATP-binding protein